MDWEKNWWTCVMRKFRQGIRRRERFDSVPWYWLLQQVLPWYGRTVSKARNHGRTDGFRNPAMSSKHYRMYHKSYERRFIFDLRACRIGKMSIVSWKNMRLISAFGKPVHHISLCRQCELFWKSWKLSQRVVTVIVATVEKTQLTFGSLLNTWKWAEYRALIWAARYHSSTVTVVTAKSALSISGLISNILSSWSWWLQYESK